MISWKHSFNRLNEEYELAKKKKNALDNLLEKGKISQPTHDSFISDIALAIAEIEKQQKDLVQKMQAKAGELEGQIKTLEMLLANYEIQHVTGEIDEDTYELEINLLSNGLDNAKNELGNIREATAHLCTPISQVDAVIPVAAPEVAAVAPAPPVENVEVEIAPTETAEMPIAPEPIIEETMVAPEVAAAPAIEEAPIVEETPIEEAAPVMEQAIEVDETVDVAAPEEIPQETATELVEEAVVEQADVENVTEDVEVEAAEPIIEEQEVATEDVTFEQTDVEETEVAEIEAVQEEEMPSIVEEIAPENPFEAPEAVQADHAEGAPEVCEETPHVSIPSAKEALSIVETSDSDEAEEEDE